MNLQQGLSVNKALFKNIIKGIKTGDAMHLHIKYLAFTFALQWENLFRCLFCYKRPKKLLKQFITKHLRITIVRSRYKYSLVVSCLPSGFALTWEYPYRPESLLSVWEPALGGHLSAWTKNSFSAGTQCKDPLSVWVWEGPFSAQEGLRRSERILHLHERALWWPERSLC